ncbi:MAG TPA: zf-HC2 domain-containing protein [Myxococcaceae bacterium]|jgi:hypothetical protein
MSPASPDLHAELDRFVDGELPPEEAERFREHLAGCAPCQARLHERVQLAGMSQHALGGEAAGARVIRPSRWIARATAVAGVAMAASLALVISGRLGGDPDPSLWLAAGAQRPLEARLSTPAADRWRPYEMTRGAEPAPPPPLPELAKLEARGKLVAIADAYLSRGAPEAARPYLDRAGESPQAFSTRAAMDLMLGHPAEALRHSARALALRPGSGAARWNHALALRALGLSMAAAAELDQVAAAGEPGWSGEAKQLAAPLRAEVERRRAAYASAKDLCQKAGRGEAPFPADARDAPLSLLRSYFDDVLARAGTAQAVRALRPAAEALDARSGGDGARRAVDRVLAQPFQGREALAREYARLTDGDQDAGALKALAERARRAGQLDLERQALELLPERLQEVERQRALALAAADPWLLAVADEHAAVRDMSGGRAGQALQILEGRVKDCATIDRAELRCLYAERGTALAHLVLGAGAEAGAMGLRALERARREGNAVEERMVLMDLARAAEARGDAALARAYAEEYRLRPVIP